MPGAARPPALPIWPCTQAAAAAGAPTLRLRLPLPQVAEAAEAQAWVDAARATPFGARKQLPAELPKGYVPKAVEAAWYEWWQECGYFKADINSGGCEMPCPALPAGCPVSKASPYGLLLCFACALGARRREMGGSPTAVAVHSRPACCLQPGVLCCAPAHCSALLRPPRITLPTCLVPQTSLLW